MSPARANLPTGHDGLPMMTSYAKGARLDVGGRVIPLVDPATGRTWAHAAVDPAAADEAVAAARGAFAGDWRDTTGAERGALLRRLGDLIATHAEELGGLETLANGKPLRATTAEMRGTARWYSYYASLIETAQGHVREISRSVEARILREPLGVVLAITPFNGALSLGSWKMAPALAAGNVVILKPPADTPASTLRLAELAADAGFPPGVVNVVIGDAEIGGYLATHRDTAMVSFTGSTTTARELGARVTGEMKRYVCEAGGKSAHIVFEDADLGSAVIAATQGAFSATGQTCVAGSRLYVHASLRDAFLERYAAAIARLRIGDPRDAATHIGPIASERQLTRVRGFVDQARDEGGRAVIGGTSPVLGGDLAGGFWFSPTVIAGVNNAMAVAREEVFGPVVAFQSFETEDEAVALANDSDYGLAAGFWTRDLGRARRVARKLQAGSVWVNTYRAIDMRLPFGGYRQSGLGRENGPEALDEFTQLKAVVVDHAPAIDPFDF